MQMHAIARALPEYESWFAPFYCDPPLARLAQSRVFAHTLVGTQTKLSCIEYLCAHDLLIDMRGQNNDYDLVVTCSDLVIPRNLRSSKILVVQEGMVRSWNPSTSVAQRLQPYVSEWIDRIATHGIDDDQPCGVVDEASAIEIAGVCRRALGRIEPSDSVSETSHGTRTSVSLARIRLRSTPVATTS